MFLLGRTQKAPVIILFASLCAGLAVAYDDIPFIPLTGVSRLILYFFAFVCSGLFVREIYRNREQTLEHLRAIESQRDSVLEAEKHLRALIETSPAAILTADADGRILMANEAARQLFGVSDGFHTHDLKKYIPALANIYRGSFSNPRFRAVMQARGFREDGEAFLADVCFSQYEVPSGVRLTAMIVDNSEDLRQHEESSLRQLMTGSRIAVGAMSHEIRNICAAISVVHQNLSQSLELTHNEDFESLGRMLDTLRSLAAIELRFSTTSCEEVEVPALLDDLRVILTPELQENSIQCAWQVDPEIPRVWADRAQLLQVFLNLANNSVRILSERSNSQLQILAHLHGNRVQIEFKDNGGGVKRPEALFRPFQEGAIATGLGLYLSRAFVRAFGGELLYRPQEGGSTFIVELNAVESGGEL
jgi:signal transduction histidine kinase